MAGLLLSTGLHAAQLGKLEVLSSSTEPFVAQIQIESIRPEERNGLQAKLASPEAFKAARLALDPKLSALTFEVKDSGKADGAIIRITSATPLPAGFLDALIELSWAGGRVAREYTFNVAEGTVPATKTQAVPEIRPPQTLPPVVPPAAAPAPKSSATEPEQAAAKSEPQPAATETRLVKKGETLSEIAQSLTGQGVTLNQAMAAIYEANREAFIANSVHLVKEGAQLRIPNKAALRAKSPREALLVLANNDGRDVYSRYARQLGLLAVADQAGQSTNSSAGKIEPKAPTDAVAAPKEDRLKIAPGGQSRAADANAEELTAKNKALAEANERIALLEKNVSDLQKLIDMQKDQGAAKAPAQAEATVAPADKPAELAADKPAEPAEVTKPAVEVPVESPAVVVPEPKKEEPPKAAPAPMPTVEQPFNLIPWLLGGAGAVVAAVVGLLVWRSRIKTEPEPFVEREPDFENLIAEDAGVAAPAVDDPPAGTLEKVADDAFDLDELLADTEPAKAETTPPPVPEFKVPEPEPQPMAAMEPEESIPELSQASAQAMAEPESLSSEVKLDFPEENLGASTEPAASSILDDLDSLSVGASAAQSEIEALRANPPAIDESAIDPDLLDDEPLSPSAPATEALPKDLEDAMADLDLDVEQPKLNDATWQEVATKLDLAGAYVEIGDADGAKELLNEIIKKGDVEQVKKAKALLATLG
ncbi:MAG TPA: FimV/HubP family polar landmark protein [Limnobacter sp.]|uniref:FimV/HubP family polar landmark protein n=1 Tax=Limnobacter sp. TaxID=2003368 RepID=UPI002ED823CF